MGHPAIESQQLAQKLTRALSYGTMGRDEDAIRVYDSGDLIGAQQIGNALRVVLFKEALCCGVATPSNSFTLRLKPGATGESTSLPAPTPDP